MKSFKQHIDEQRLDLNEGRDAPLYHGTAFESAISILGHGKIMPRTMQNIRGRSEYQERQNGSKYRAVKHNDRFHGVSTTRDFAYAKNWISKALERNVGIVFEINQAKLSNNFKLIPYTFGGQTNGGVSRKIYSNEYFCMVYGHGSESEEFVLTNKGVPISYITKIHAFISKSDTDMRQMLLNELEKHNIHTPVVFYDKLK